MTRIGVVGGVVAAVGAAVALGARTSGRLFRVVVHGVSMAPAFEPGDFLVALGRGRVGRGTVVVVERPDRPGLEMVKRVVAIPGDRPGHAILGPGEYWVLGDNPDLSTDSRAFGPVRAGHIRGVVILRYWPPRRFRIPSRRPA